MRKLSVMQYLLIFLGLDALCIEAIYNLGSFYLLILGIVYKKEAKYELALKWFEKLHSIVNNSSEVIFEIADIYDKIGNLTQSLEWYNILISVVPTDPGILARLANMFERNGDRGQAFQYYSEVLLYTQIYSLIDIFHQILKSYHG